MALSTNIAQKCPATIHRSSFRLCFISYPERGVDRKSKAGERIGFVKKLKAAFDFTVGRLVRWLNTPIEIWDINVGPKYAVTRARWTLLLVIVEPQACWFAWTYREPPNVSREAQNGTRPRVPFCSSPRVCSHFFHCVDSYIARISPADKALPYTRTSSMQPCHGKLQFDGYILGSSLPI